MLWQTGSTDVAGLGIDAAGDRVGQRAERGDSRGRTDAVVVHAGARHRPGGDRRLESAPSSFRGRAMCNEHVDDHQAEIAMGAAARRGLAVVADADDLEWSTSRSRRPSEVTADHAPPFSLVG